MDGHLRSRRIDALRGVAAGSVLLGHVWTASHGFRPSSATFSDRVMLAGGQGVYLFFALSGFLLSLPFLRAAFGDGPPVDLRRYATNRVLRIVPLFYAVVVALLVLQPFGADRGDAWRFLFFVHPFSLQTLNTLDPPMWSLASEVQFYAMLPVLMLALRAGARGAVARAGVLILLAGGVSYLLRANLTEWSVDLHTWSRYILGWGALGSLLCYFAVGILVALASVHVHRGGLPRLPAPLRHADAYLAAGALTWLATAAWTGGQPLMLLASPLLLAGAVLPLQAGLLTRVLEWRPLGGLGVISYSVYLLHVPILIALTDATKIPGRPAATGRDLDFLPLLGMTVPLVVAVATATYLAIERPFLNLRKRVDHGVAPVPVAAGATT